MVSNTTAGETAPGARGHLLPRWGTARWSQGEWGHLQDGDPSPPGSWPSLDNTAAHQPCGGFFQDTPLDCTSQEGGWVSESHSHTGTLLSSCESVGSFTTREAVGGLACPSPAFVRSLSQVRLQEPALPSHPPCAGDDTPTARAGPEIFQTTPQSVPVTARPRQELPDMQKAGQGTSVNSEPSRICFLQGNRLEKLKQPKYFSLPYLISRLLQRNRIYIERGCILRTWLTQL